MSSNPNLPSPASGRSRHGFTLAEVLAALAFLAIVIPVAVEGLRVAARAGQAGHAREVATRIAQRILNESTAAQSLSLGLSRGTVEEDARVYQWTLRAASWPEDSMRLLTVDVAYEIQGEPFQIAVSTLADPNAL